MSSTYTARQALDFARQYLHGLPIDNVNAETADIVASLIWRAYPWRWTMADLSDITLVDGTQDYAVGVTDLYRPVSMRIARTDVSPVTQYELSIYGYLSPNVVEKGGYGFIRSVAYEPVTNKFRLDVSAGITSPTTMVLRGQYQKNPTRITDSTLDTAFAQPDQYFNVMVEGLKWKLYQLADDQRTGGQYQLFQAELQKMKADEDWGDAQQFTFPEDSLGQRRMTNPGLFQLF